MTRVFVCNCSVDVLLERNRHDVMSRGVVRPPHLLSRKVLVVAQPWKLATACSKLGMAIPVICVGLEAVFIMLRLFEILLVSWTVFSMICLASEAFVACSN